MIEGISGLRCCLLVRLASLFMWAAQDLNSRILHIAWPGDHSVPPELGHVRYAGMEAVCSDWANQVEEHNDQGSGPVDSNIVLHHAEELTGEEVYGRSFAWSTARERREVGSCRGDWR